MNYQIVISYRRDGGEALACLISEKLKQAGFEVFYDVESLRSGKFNNEILRVIDNCKDVIVVLPQNGLDRCENEDDWVRKEVAHAIKTNKNIVPVLMRNFEFPERLPEDIEELRNYNGVSANMEYFDATFQKLLSLLKSENSHGVFRAEQLTDDEELQKELAACISAMKTDGGAEAAHNLACCYWKLENSELNEEIARLFRIAAKAGHAGAKNNLGVCYEHGIGVEKNLFKAFELYNESAQLGNAHGQYHFARQLKLNYSELSEMWLNKAKSNGFVMTHNQHLEFYNIEPPSLKDRLHYLFYGY